MASIDKKGRRWRVRWRDPGTKHPNFSASFHSHDEAKAFRRHVEDYQAAGGRGDPREQDGADDAVPLLVDLRPDAAGDAVTAYLDHLLARGAAPATVHRHARALELFRRFLVETFDVEVIDLDVLSRKLMEQYVAWLREPRTRVHGKEARAPETVRKTLEVAQRLWSWCYDEPGLEEHTPRPRPLKLEAAPGRPPVAARWEELDRVIAHLEAWYPWLCTVLRFTGLRVQQAMRLRPSDLVLERATLLVRPELGKTKMEQRGREVPVSTHFVALVRELRAAGHLRDDDEWLIPSKRRGTRARLARSSRIATAWQKAGIREEVWSGRPHHAFRKAFASELKRAGADQQAIGYLVGHDLGLSGIYTDPDALPLRTAVSKIPPLGEAARFILSRSFDVVTEAEDAAA